MTCAKLWPDWNISFQVRVAWTFQRFGLWAHELFVNWSQELQFSGGLKRVVISQSRDRPIMLISVVYLSALKWGHSKCSRFLRFSLSCLNSLAPGRYMAVTRGWGTPKNFWQGCAAPVFDRIPLAKEILLENICTLGWGAFPDHEPILTRF